MKKIIFVFMTVFLIMLVIPQTAKAACPLPAKTNITFQSGDVCTISSPNGADYTTSETSTSNSAIITIPTGASITINANSNAILMTGSIKLTGGTMSLQSAPLPANRGKILLGTPIYIADSDADGWANDFTIYTATASGRRRLSLMNSLSTVDCNANSFNVSNICCQSIGSSCSQDSTCCSSICGTDSDGDQLFSQAAGHTGICQSTSYPYTDTNDAVYCPSGYNPSEICAKCVNGDKTYQTSAEDIFSECPTGTCENGLCNGSSYACQDSGTYSCSKCAYCCSPPCNCGNENCSGTGCKCYNTGCWNGGCDGCGSRCGTSACYQDCNCSCK